MRSLAAAVPSHYKRLANAEADKLFIDMLPWLGLLVVIVLVLGGIAIWLRKKTSSPISNTSEGYTLQELRRMHAEGELTDEEFEKAREVMITGIKGRQDSDPGPSEEAETHPNRPSD